jgi:hypothetical protein
LEEAVSWCRSYDLEFDAVNENLSEMVEFFGNDSRKIFADGMFGSCDKEPLVEVFAALLVKLNDNGVIFSFPDVQNDDYYMPIYDSNGILREKLKLPKSDILLFEEIKLDFYSMIYSFCRNLKGKV